ncbi:protein of unknown function [Filimonas lacunae]|uniref:Uncharacterized protein n=1 Tax=Filimonas lacunae TaxID=477680 RepID=A0A173MAB1_9BACT|nr:DUF4133 domain-containing protein [Filimonas lacunae]BAV04449.1 conjugative transposon protein TraF [Filimonas lacunae]SIT31469.1 protein of unknown function [Filimonas lacunae]
MSVLEVNKGVNRPIVFKGFKAQYISFLAIGLVAILLIFAILYVIGVNIYVTLIVVLPSGAAYMAYIQNLSKKYGQHGLMKNMANKILPDNITTNSANIFQQINTTYEINTTGKDIPHTKS